MIIAVRWIFWSIFLSFLAVFGIYLYKTQKDMRGFSPMQVYFRAFRDFVICVFALCIPGVAMAYSMMLAIQWTDSRDWSNQSVRFILQALGAFAVGWIAFYFYPLLLIPGSLGAYQAIRRYEMYQTRLQRERLFEAQGWNPAPRTT